MVSTLKKHLSFILISSFVISGTFASPRAWFALGYPQEFRSGRNDQDFDERSNINSAPYSASNSDPPAFSAVSSYGSPRAPPIAIGDDIDVSKAS